MRVDEADVVSINARIYCKQCAAKAPVRTRAGTSGHQVPTRGPTGGTRVGQSGSHARRTPSTGSELPAAKLARSGTGAAHVPRPSTQSGSRQNRADPTDGGGGSNKTLIVILSLAGVLLAGAAVFMMSRPATKPGGSTGTPMNFDKAIVQTPPNIEPAKIPGTDGAPKNTIITPPTVPEIKTDPKSPVPAGTVDVMAGVREESARRALDQLIADQKAGTISSVLLRRRYDQFLSGSYKTTAVANEARERMNTLPPLTLRAAQTPPAPTVPGLEMKICEGYEPNQINGVPISQYKIQQKKAVPNINAPNVDKIQELAGRRDMIILVFDGYVEIPKDGSYVFYTISDDASLVFIDDELLLINDGDHGMEPVSESTDLKAGKHRYRVVYRQGGGGCGLIEEWSGPDLGRQVIPASAFSHVP